MKKANRPTAKSFQCLDTLSLRRPKSQCFNNRISTDTRTKKGSKNCVVMWNNELSSFTPFPLNSGRGQAMRKDVESQLKILRLNSFRFPYIFFRLLNLAVNKIQSFPLDGNSCAPAIKAEWIENGTRYGPVLCICGFGWVGFSKRSFYRAAGWFSFIQRFACLNEIGWIEIIC